MMHRIVINLTLVVFASVIALFTVKPVPAAPAGLASPTQITLSGQPVVHSSPGIADFNGDGRQEIIAGGQDGMVYVLSLVDATWQVVWSRQTALDMNAHGAPTERRCVTNINDIQSAPAVADLDNDGKLEIVLTTGGDIGNHRNGGVLVYQYQGAAPNWQFSLVQGWPQPKLDQTGAGAGNGQPDGCWDGIWSTPALGDIDGDGDMEIVFEGFDRRIHAYHHNGQAVNGWPIFRGNGDALLRGGWSSPALGDIDGDGLLEVVVGTDSPVWGGEGSPNPRYDNGTLWAINGDSTNVPGWPVRIDQTVQSSPAIGDLDNDGQLEVVVGTGTGIAGRSGFKVYAFRANGTPLPNWPRPTNGNVTASPALVDLDKDGKLDVVVGCGTESSPRQNACSSIYAWRTDGTNLPGFPATPSNNNAWTSEVSAFPFGPVVADYTGDGLLDIIVLSRFTFGYTSLSSSGQEISDPVLRAQYVLWSAPLIEDVDGDGKLEIVSSGPSANNTNGAVYIWETTADASNLLPWPMFRRNMLRNGLVPIPSTVGNLSPKVFLPVVAH